MIKHKIKKICFITSSRSEYGIIANLLLKIKKENCFEINFIITGSHLSKSHGYTYREIINDGFKLNKIFKLKTYVGDKTENIIKTISKNFIGYQRVVKKIKPDVVFLLGDRYELIPAGYVSLFNNIPVIHFHGGELTVGAYDDYIRNTITKLSSYHFVIHAKYKKRVIQMGESPQKVFNYGGLGAENIEVLRKKLLTKAKIKNNLGINLLNKNILVTYHPVTLENDKYNKEFKIILKVLEKFNNLGIIFTSPNSDTNNNSIIKLIKNFVKKNNNSFYIKSLGRVNYFSLVNICDCVLGNSSSGILEVPSFNKFTINIGNRQMGRILSKTVLSINAKNQDIINSINYVMKNKDKYKNLTKNNIYYKPKTSEKIISTLKKIKLPISLKKGFYDI